MPFSLSMQRFSVLILSVLAAGIGTGCGGGDSSSGAVSLASPASTTLSGTAAVGSPIVGGGLNVVCSAGAPLMTSTSANGSWTVDTTSQTFPCAVQVKGGTVAGATNLITYHSIALNPGIANVTPLTDLLLANLAGTATPSAWYASVVAAPVTLSTFTQTKADASLINLRAGFGATLANGPHPITAAFTAVLGNAMDDILSALAKALASTTVDYSALLALAGSSASASFSSPAGFNAALSMAYAPVVGGSAPTEQPLGVREFKATGSLMGERNSHAALLLPGGKVLVSGGFGANSLALATAELYDPVTASWTTAANMLTARSSPAATVLSSGKVLVSGGQNRLVQPTSIASAELYDPATNTWAAAGTLATARSVHTATLLPNGKVLVAGGLNTAASASNIRIAELYDPATNAWTSAGTMTAARYAHTATLLPSGKVLVTGGVTASGDVATSELYDPATNSWTAASPMGAPRNLHTAVLLPNGKLLVAGGSSFATGVFITLKTAEIYDPVTNAWTAAAPMAIARVSHTVNTLTGGKVLVSGGFSSLSSGEVYDVGTNAWTPTGPMTAGRHAHGATLLSNGSVLISGGVGSQPASAELF